MDCVKPLLQRAGVYSAYLLLVLVVWPIPTSGYGLDAHRVVGFIAEQQVCPETRGAVRSLMGRFELATAGIWADRIRSRPDWRHASPWHFINVPDGVAVRDARRVRNGDVLWAIEHFQAQLHDFALPVEQRREALQFLVHFVADLHQPLHVGRRQDLGGNRVNVTVDGTLTNLHRYWDTLVLTPVLDNPRSYALRLELRLREADAEAWRVLDPYEWAQESMDLREAVYAFERPARGFEPVPLSAAYQARALEITERRLLQAGVRVAASLDEVYCTREGAHGL